DPDLGKVVLYQLSYFRIQPVNGVVVSRLRVQSYYTLLNCANFEQTFFKKFSLPTASIRP
ncbi:MAG: hypothetical protein ACI30V_02105, partial [Muribaculaceae bacterium]